MKKQTDAEKLNKLREIMLKKYEHNGLMIVEHPYYEIEDVVQASSDEASIATLRRVQGTLAKMHDVLWDCVKLS